MHKTYSVMALIFLVLLVNTHPVFASGNKGEFLYSQDEIHPGYLHLVTGFLQSTRVKVQTYENVGGKFTEAQTTGEFQIDPLSYYGYGGMGYRERSYFAVYDRHGEYLQVGVTPKSKQKVWIKQSQGDMVYMINELAKSEIKLRLFYLSKNRSRAFFDKPYPSSSVVNHTGPEYRNASKTLEARPDRLDTYRFAPDAILGNFVHVRMDSWAYGIGEVPDKHRIQGWVEIYDRNGQITIWP